MTERDQAASTGRAVRSRGAGTRRSGRRADGCGFIVVTCLVTCLLMIVNGGLVAASYGWLSSVGPSLLRHPRFAQACLFVLPVLLLFVQWWVIDRLLDLFRPGPSRPARP